MSINPWRGLPSCLAPQAQRTLMRGREGMKSVRMCVMNDELDMATLVWTRGAEFPIARLESRMKCPRCGSLHVTPLFEVPREPMKQRA